MPETLAIVRRADGSIDTDRYCDHGHRLRGLAVQGAFRSAWRRLCDVLRACGHAAQPNRWRLISAATRAVSSGGA
jgi:hypothetical protein